MKTMLPVFAAMAFMSAQAHAQVMVQQVEETTTTHEVTANPYDNQAPATTTTTYTTVETTAVGSMPTVDPGRMATVKLEDGTTVQFPDTAEKGWQEYAREKGYNRFTFDPTSGLFVVGKGEARFEGRWNDQGERVQSHTLKPTKAAAKPAMSKPAETEEPAPAETAPMTEPATEETPATPTAQTEPTAAGEVDPAGTDTHGSGH